MKMLTRWLLPLPLTPLLLSLFPLPLLLPPLPLVHAHSSTWLCVHPTCAYVVALVPATWSCVRPPLAPFIHPHLHLSVLVPACLCVHTPLLPGLARARLYLHLFTLMLTSTCPCSLSHSFLLNCAYTPPACMRTPAFTRCLVLHRPTFIHPCSVAPVLTTWSSLLVVSTSCR
jgi:hypothetical protein